jgi:hypothetical protein
LTIKITYWDIDLSEVSPAIRKWRSFERKGTTLGKRVARAFGLMILAELLDL